MAAEDKNKRNHAKPGIVKHRDYEDFLPDELKLSKEDFHAVCVRRMKDHFKDHDHPIDYTKFTIEMSEKMRSDMIEGWQNKMREIAYNLFNPTLKN